MKESRPQRSEEAALDIVGERVALGPLREDLPPICGRWINDLVTMRTIGFPPGPVMAEKEQARYEQ